MSVHRRFGKYQLIIAAALLMPLARGETINRQRLIARHL